MDQQRTIQDVLNYMNTPAGLGAQLARGGGEMRAPVNDRMVSAGSAMKQFPLTQSMGGAVEKLGQGMRLEPRDYAGAAMEGAALMPGGGAARGAAVEAGALPKALREPLEYKHWRAMRDHAIKFDTDTYPIPGVGVLPRKANLAARVERQRGMAADLEQQILGAQRAAGDGRAPITDDLAARAQYLLRAEPRKAAARWEARHPWRGTPPEEMAPNAALYNAMNRAVNAAGVRNIGVPAANGVYRDSQRGEAPTSAPRSLNDALRTPNAVR